MKNIDTLSPQFMVGMHSVGFDKCLRTLHNTVESYRIHTTIYETGEQQGPTV